MSEKDLINAITDMFNADKEYGCGFYTTEKWINAYEKLRKLSEDEQIMSKYEWIGVHYVRKEDGRIMKTIHDLGNSYSVFTGMEELQFITFYQAQRYVEKYFTDGLNSKQIKIINDEKE